MQLFGLVNTLLSNDAETSRRDLSIRRYAVTPLSHDVGVVGWVPNSDTLHQLIRDHRDSRKVLLNVEHRLMLMMAPMHDSLGVLQKVGACRGSHAADAAPARLAPHAVPPPLHLPPRRLTNCAGGGVPQHHGEHDGAGPVQGPVAQVAVERGVAGPAHRLQPVAGGHVHRRLHPRPRGPPPVQHHARPLQRRPLPHRLRRLLRGGHDARQVPRARPVPPHAQ